jgi:hypothetical protein
VFLRPSKETSDTCFFVLGARLVRSVSADALCKETVRDPMATMEDAFCVCAVRISSIVSFALMEVAADRGDAFSDYGESFIPHYDLNCHGGIDSADDFITLSWFPNSVSIRMMCSVRKVDVWRRIPRRASTVSMLLHSQCSHNLRAIHCLPVVSLGS